MSRVGGKQKMRIATNQRVLLGPPGTGKTTTLISLIASALQSGIQPEEIAFVSFTKKAVQEALERACAKFKLPARRFPLFQTVHALAFRQLGCTKENLMNRSNYLELGNYLGYDMSGQFDTGEGVFVSGATPGDKFLFIDQMSRTRCEPLRKTWEDLSDSEMPWDQMKDFADGYRKYKDRTGLMDFTDLLQVFIETGKPTQAKLVFIDEAQDLSKIQWNVLKKCYSNAEEVIIAGDDDQSIFKWSGADLEAFLALEGEQQVLAKSYRLPVAVYNKAQTIIKQVRRRFNKEFSPTDKKGRIEYVSMLDQADVKPGETTLVLVRNVFLLPQVYEHIKRLGVTYTGRGGVQSVQPGHVQAIKAWESMRKGNPIALEDVREIYEHLRIGKVLERGGKTKLNHTEEDSEGYTWETLRDHYGLLSKPVWHEAFEGIPLETREYYLTVLRAGNKISAEPKITVNTIHGVKGGEADHVIIISDMSKRTFLEYQNDPCSEHRVAFVAITRAKERVTIVMPRSKYSYQY